MYVMSTRFNYVHQFTTNFVFSKKRLTLLLNPTDRFLDFLYYLGHEKLVELFLRKGANINAAIPGSKRTAIYSSVGNTKPIFNTI